MRTRVLTALLGLTAFATVAVEVLNWWVSPEGGYGLFVRTAWALLRSLGFLVVIVQVRRGRASARPFALILCVTTLFALARLVVPRQGLPDPRGVAGFVVVAVLCAAVLLLLYRWAPLPVASKRPPMPGWLLTARVAMFSYGPLMIVAAAVSLGEVFGGRLAAIGLVVAWFLIGIAVTYATLFIAIFLDRARHRIAPAVVAISIGVLVVHLPLCWLLLGADGLLRDGAPVLFAALLALFAVHRAR